MPLKKSTPYKVRSKTHKALFLMIPKADYRVLERAAAMDGLRPGTYARQAAKRAAEKRVAEKT